MGQHVLCDAALRRVARQNDRGPAEPEQAVAHLEAAEAQRGRWKVGGTAGNHQGRVGAGLEPRAAAAPKGRGGGSARRSGEPVAQVVEPDQPRRAQHHQQSGGVAHAGSVQRRPRLRASSSKPSRVTPSASA